MTKIIGVDLGSANSAAAFTRTVGSQRMTSVVPTQHGATQQGMVFPSYVKFGTTGEVECVGEEARVAMGVSPRRVVWGVKRLIGRAYSELTPEDRARFLYPIVEGDNNDIVIPIGSRSYTPADISRILLETIRAAAEDASIPGNMVAGTVDGAVVTRPAYFDTTQIEATRDSARSAGFSAVSVISEPEAAAVSHGIELAEEAETSFVMTIDWGAGTLDVVISLLTEHPTEDSQLFESVAPPYGDVSLGGIDMDDALVSAVIESGGLTELDDVLAAMRNESEGLSAEHDDALRTLAELRLAVEQVKIDLSNFPFKETYIQVRRRPFRVKIARTAADVPDQEPGWVILEEAIAPQLERFRTCLVRSLELAGLAPDSIQHLLLVGGPMRMPSARAIVSEIFASNAAVSAQLQAIELEGFPVDPMECVARGASLWAVRDELGEVRMQKVTLPRSYGIIVAGKGFVESGERLLARGSATPCEGSMSLNAPGSPGDAIVFSLAEIDADDEDKKVWRKIGDHSFFPIYVAGSASFRMTLEADEEDAIRAVLTDSRNREPLTLEMANKGEVGRVPQPEAFGDPDEPELGGGWTPPPPLSSAQTVPPAKVEEARNQVTACLALARAALSEGAVSAEERSSLTVAVSSLEEALGDLPEGPAQQITYAVARNRCAALTQWLRVHGLLDPGTEGVS